MPSARLTSKGQITIPLAVRARLGLKKGDRLDFVLEPDGRLRVEPKRVPFEKLRGLLRTPGRRRVSLREMDRAVAKAVQARWRRASGSRAG